MKKLLPLAYKYIILSLLFGLLAGFIDVLLDYFYFYSPESLIDLLILNVPPHEIYTRALLLVLFVAFGIIVQILSNKVKRNTETLYATLNSIDQCVITTDLENKIISMNPIAEKTLDCHIKNVKGERLSTIFKTIDHKTRKPLDSPTEIAIKNIQSVTPKNHVILLHKNGTEIRIHNSATPLIGKLGNITGAVLTFKNCTNEYEIQQKIQHINQVLYTFSSITKLLTQEKDEDLLLKGICSKLIETRSYHNAWIVLFDNNGNFRKAKEAGVGSQFQTLRQMFTQGEIADCAKKAMNEFKVIVTNSPYKDCKNCCLIDNYTTKGALTIRLEHHNIIFGILTVSVPKRFIDDKDEHQLIKDLAKNIAIRLYNIRLENEHAQAIIALKESEEKHKSLYENAPLPYQSLNVDGSFRDVNPAWLSVLGYNKEEVLNQNFGQFLHPDWKPHFKKNFPIFKKQGYIKDVQFKIRHKEGHYVDIAFEGCIGHNPDGSFKQTYCVFQDITKRKMAESDLVNAHARMKALIESQQNVLIFTLDKDYCYSAFNENHKNEMKLIYKVDICEGMNMLELITIPEVKEKAKLSFDRVINGERFEEIQEQPNTGIFYHFYWQPIINKTGEIIGISCLIIDITENRKTEKLILKNQYYLSKAQEIGKIGSWELDLKNNNLRWSAENYKIFGVELGTKMNYELFLKRIHPDDRNYVNQQWNHALETNQYDIQHRLLIDNKTKWVREKARVEYDKEGNPELAIGFTQDITDRKASEEQLNTLNANLAVQNEEYETLNEELKESMTNIQQINEELIISKKHAEESDRLKSAFLANMSHEIRTPMNGILGFSSLLKRPNLKSEQFEKYIAIIEKSGVRMLNIINDLIDISRIESGQMEVAKSPCILNDQFDYLSTFFMPEANAKSIKLIVNNPLFNDNIKFQTDCPKLYAILSNLIKNAIKYTPQGTIEFGCNKQNNSLLFFVKDTGIGIPQNRLNAIFDRFVQADIEDKSAYEGAGLGLAIAKSYVHMLGGKIGVTSTEGTGSEFYFTLPFEQEEANPFMDTTATPIVEKNSKFEQKLKIIIAEDEEFADTFLSIVIEDLSSTILHAKTGTEVVELIQNNSDTDLILMDIKMPELNGYEATRKIRTFNNKVIIIAQTANAMAGDHEKAIQAGCDDYISKPIDKMKLSQMIGAHFNKE